MVCVRVGLVIECPRLWMRSRFSATQARGLASNASFGSVAKVRAEAYENQHKRETCEKCSDPAPWTVHMSKTFHVLQCFVGLQNKLKMRVHRSIGRLTRTGAVAIGHTRSCQDTP